MIESGQVMTSLALSRLLQLASPMLPVGAYSYSQGLETAIETGLVRDAETASEWISDVLTLYLGRFELPLLWRMSEAFNAGADAAVWNTMYCTGRDTSESRAETLQMGYSLARLLRDLDPGQPLGALEDMGEISFPIAYAWAAVRWNIPAEACVQAYAWAWVENQAAAAMKTVPIGQVAGQRILLALGETIPAVVKAARELPEEDISNFAPGLALLACRHEVQYSRLFRS
jgi:urease accessory protein